MAATDTGYDSQPGALDMIAKVQGKVIEQFELELNEMRATMMAMMTDLTATADRERARAESLAGHLEAARRELQRVRAECRAEVEAAREAAVRYRDETSAWYQRQLNAAQALAQSAAESETKIREELSATHARNQEVVDAQMLRIVELKRALELARGDADRSGAVPERPSKQPVVKLAQRTATAETHRQPEPKRNHLAPEFAAIEAALASSPPIPAAWERIA